MPKPYNNTHLCREYQIVSTLQQCLMIQKEVIEKYLEIVRTEAGKRAIQSKDGLQADFDAIQQEVVALLTGEDGISDKEGWSETAISLLNHIRSITPNK
jgi:hypothetical protein